MTRLIALVLAICALPVTALAACPATDAAARDARTAALFDALAASETEDRGMAIASQIWSIWAEAPDTQSQALLDFGMLRIQQGAFGEAEKALGRLIAYCPDYPEGWNQRAFARFLARDYNGTLADLDAALALEPRHFGALAGRALTFFSQGDRPLGEEALRAAVAVHPWMNERHLLPPEQRL